MKTNVLKVVNKAIRNPQRAALRLVLKAREAKTPLSRDRYRLLGTISRAWNVDAWELRDEYRKSEFARWYRDRLAQLRATSGSSRMGTSGDFHCEAMYVLVRAAKPQTVLETGVLYGASSGHILAALEANGHGRLFSVDLGVQPGEPAHDSLVHPRLLPRWEYIVGDAREELPRLLARLGRIDMFHHDSLHTYDHMMWEFATVAPHLSARGVLASHDVFVSESLRSVFRQNAFPAFCEERDLRHIMVRNSGIARPRRTRPSTPRIRRPSLEPA